MLLRVTAISHRDISHPATLPIRRPFPYVIFHRRHFPSVPLSIRTTSHPRHFPSVKLSILLDIATKRMESGADGKWYGWKVAWMESGADGKWRGWEGSSDGKCRFSLGWEMSRWEIAVTRSAEIQVHVVSHKFPKHVLCSIKLPFSKFESLLRDF